MELQARRIPEIAGNPSDGLFNYLKHVWCSHLRHIVCAQCFPFLFLRNLGAEDWLVYVLSRFWEITRRLVGAYLSTWVLVDT